MGNQKSKCEIVDSCVAHLNKQFDNIKIECIRHDKRKNLEDLVNNTSGCDWIYEGSNIVFIIKYKGKDYGILELESRDGTPCLYISYRCSSGDGPLDANKPYMGDVKPPIKGIGTYMGFIAVFLATCKGKRYVLSNGISDKKYMIKRKGRYAAKYIAISQLILINKFGFVDTYDLKIDRGHDTKFLKPCGHLPETYIDLITGDRTKYENYKNIVFAKMSNSERENKLFPLRE